MTNSEIIKFLTSTTVNAGFVDKLKIKYRPVICPFDDLMAYAKDTKSVFDVGCGSGQFCALVANFTGVNTIKGIEINERLVNNANQVNQRFSGTKNIKFAVFDGNTIPDDIVEYDLIYMIDVYHHIPQSVQKPFMKQLFDKMKPGARLMFKDIDAGSPLVICNKLHDLVFAKEIGKEISFKAAKSLLTEVGFKIVEEYKKTVFVYPHYFILAVK
ncbi:MAG: class I SAM-dependent methyltransferase [Sediminibacterium sp.]|nr:class I SAM-dependent methyltransferase [Sediminibacterium sp.]